MSAPDPTVETVGQAITRWTDDFDEGNNVMFGEDGYRVLIFVVDVTDPGRTLEDWREAAHVELRDMGSYGAKLVEVKEVW